MDDKKSVLESKVQNYTVMTDEEKSKFEEKVRNEAKQLMSKTQNTPTKVVAKPVKGEFFSYDSDGKNSNMNRLEDVKNAMVHFNKELVVYMQSIEPGEIKKIPVIRDKEITELEPAVWRNLWGLMKREEITKIIKVQDYETKEIKRVDYKLEDLRNLVFVSLGKLDEFNNELIQYGQNIGETVGVLLDTRKRYVEDTAQAERYYETANKEIERIDNVIQEYDSIILTLKGTDQKKVDLEKELADLEIKLIEVKSDASISGETALIKNNYKDILKAYSIILGDTKEEARRWTTYISHFIQGVNDVDITMENVFNVCSYIGEACGVMGETVGHMRFISNKLGQLYQVIQRGRGPELDSPIEIEKIMSEIEVKSDQEEQYRNDLDKQVQPLINPQIVYNSEKNIDDYIQQNRKEQDE